MKAVFIVYGQALSEPVQNILDKCNIRGFTRWEETFGRGSNNGDPHYGNHAWPSKNASVLTVVEEHKVEPLMNELFKLNNKTEQQGLNAFVWNIDEHL